LPLCRVASGIASVGRRDDRLRNWRKRKEAKRQEYCCECACPQCYSVAGGDVSIFHNLISFHDFDVY
jgi:hypothetical protein